MHPKNPCCWYGTIHDRVILDAGSGIEPPHGLHGPGACGFPPEREQFREGIR